MRKLDGNLGRGGEEEGIGGFGGRGGGEDPGELKDDGEAAHGSETTRAVEEIWSPEGVGEGRNSERPQQPERGVHM